MKKILIGLVVLLLGVAGLIVLRGERLALAYVASQTETQSFDALSDLLVPAMVWRLPDPEIAGPGPYPLFVQMHGCGGMNIDQHGSYANIANAAGYAALIVSSNRPRGFDQARSLEEICQGRALLGQERAADIFVALTHALARDDIDPERIVLGGWSHGAWTVMDYLSFDQETGLPPGLADYDGPRPEIDAAVLFYPYCGFGSRTRVYGWEQSPKIITLMGTVDTIVDYTECQAAFDRVEAAGAEIERHFYEAEHAFDNAALRGAIAHWYDAEASADARAKVAEFLAAQVR